MTAAQQRYHDAVVARAHQVDVTEYSGGSVRLTVHNEDEIRARIVLSSAGKLVGAWDPDHLTDIIDGDLYGREPS